MLATTLTTILRRQGAVEAPYVFSPSELFASSEKGVWYDPSDFTTLYADTAGTTAITAVEQPVGLMLDKSQGLVLGSEIIAVEADQNFDSDTGFWALGAQASISGGSFNITAGTGVQISKTIATLGLTQGKTYKVVYTISSISGSFRWQFSSAVVSRTSPGTYTEYWRPDGSTLQGNCVTTTTMSMDSISIKELPGNHAVAANGSTARPVLRNRYNALQYSEAFDNAYWTKSNITVTANTETAPDATTTADTLEATSANGTALGSFSAAAASYKFSVWIKRKTGTGNVDITAHSGGTWVTQSITSSWARYTVTQTLTSGTRTPGIRLATSGDEVYVWGAQITTAADDAAINGEYQRIAAAPTVGSAPTYDDDVTKFPVYLSFDGVDDALSVGVVYSSFSPPVSIYAGLNYQTITGSASNEGGVTICSDSNNYFALIAATSNRAGQVIRGLNASTEVPLETDYTTVGSVPLLTNKVIGLEAGFGSSSFYIDGSLNSTVTHGWTTETGANYGIGLSSRNRTAGLSNMRYYGVVVLDRVLTATERDDLASYLADKTGVTI